MHQPHLGLLHEPERNETASEMGCGYDYDWSISAPMSRSDLELAHEPEGLEFDGLSWGRARAGRVGLTA